MENIQLRRAASDLLDLLDPISSAINRFQNDDCFLSEAAELWMELVEKSSPSHKAKAMQRAEEAMEPALCAANLIDPRFLGKNMNVSQVQNARSYIVDLGGEEVISDLDKLLAFEEPFTEDSCKTVSSPRRWWRAGVRRFGFPVILSELAMDLSGIVCSSASLERAFSTLGTTYGHHRNNLGVEKAMKLTFLHHCFNK